VYDGQKLLPIVAVLILIHNISVSLLLRNIKLL